MAALTDPMLDTCELVVKEKQPEITEEMVAGFQTVLAHYSTPFNPGREQRTHNLRLAMGMVNQKVIRPGERFSANAVIGERLEEKGYKSAPIFLEGEVVPSTGGGVCQVASTLYNAALLAGLEITERNKHSFPSSYVREGFDAAVNWPDKDLKFTNNTDGPIFIKSGIFKDEKDNTLNARVWIYGKPLPDGQYYERDSKEIERLDPPAPEIVPDEKQEYIEFVYYDDEQHVYRDSHGSLKIQTYRVLKDKDGNEISREAMYEDHYRAITGLTYVGIVPAYKRPPDVNHDGIPDVDTDGDGIVDMIDKDGDRVGDIPWTPPKKHDDDSGDDNDDDDD